MLSVVCFADEQLPNIRLMTSVGLYFDDVTIPLARKYKSEALLRLLSLLPKHERDLISSNSNFYKKYKSLERNTFRFLNSLSNEKIVNEIIEIYQTVPPEIDAQKLHFISSHQHMYGMGCFFGKKDAISNQGLNEVVLPFSYSTAQFAMPNNLQKDERFADIVASLLAVEAIQISLPDLQALHPDEILWARERLANELNPFRMSMYRLAKSIRSLIGENPSIDIIKAEATFLVKTTVLPDVLAFRQRLAQENKSFTRKIIIKSLDAFKLAVNYVVSPNPMKLAAFTSQAVSGLIDYSEYRNKVRSLEVETAVSYLAKLSDVLPKKPQRSRSK